MTSPTKAAQIVDDVHAALRRSLDVRHAESLESFVAPGKFARYMREPRLVVAQHFDLKPAFLILDPLLGTLGIVDLVLPESGQLAAPTSDKGSEKPKDDGGVGQRVRESIDHATYIRHLLLRDRSRAELPPLTVELVLLTADETDDEKLTVETIGTALRDVLRDADSLFHIGVSVLCHGGSTVGLEGRLRRAFPWLLRATRRWLSSPRANPQPAPADQQKAPSDAQKTSADSQKAASQTRRRLRHLKLTNYRLPGERVITLSDARVHLVHGPNGSGKSSIAEALEIATSGKVERLEQAGEKRYDQVIRNTQSQRPATIEIGWLLVGGSESQLDDPRSIGPDGLENPLDKTVDASSFRLDQPLMDRLIGNFPHARARIFMRAFFPEAVPSLSAYEQATQAHDQTLAKVDRVVDGLRSARDALIKLQDWRGGTSTQTVEAFHVLLNRWLEQTALVDLLQRERSVRATIRAAQAADWKPSGGTTQIVASLGSEIETETLERFEREGMRAIDELQRKLASFGSAMPTGALPEGAAHLVARPAVETLNAVSRFLFSEQDLQSYGLLGNKLAAVINTGDAGTYANTVIGIEKWTEPIVRDLDALIADCADLRAEEKAPPEWRGKTPCAEYDEARETHAARLAAGRDLTVHFVDKLRPDDGATGEFDGSLIAALNELIALFTPARWAYADIRLPPKFGEGKLGLPITLGDVDSAVRAELHLNTAELNLFTLALFLLCVGRVPKPLNLLVFDDPLQNMDELTSTALARGFAKIVRLWTHLGRGEELLLLFHGYEDLNRFRSEVAAATYRLPWLSPSPAPTAISVKADGLAGDVLAVQKVDGIWLQVAE